MQHFIIEVLRRPVEFTLRQRQLATDFDYNFRISLRFTFGSIFNNIVNPRFDSGGGRQVFFFN